MIERVTVDGTEVVLVGTAHVSEQSAREVEAVIDAEDPDVVCVELDEKRYESLTEEEQWKNLQVREALKEGKGSLLLMNIVLSIYQRRIGESLDVKPGSEMLAAVNAAKDRDVPVNLIDRDIQDTIRDAMSSLSLLEKMKLLSYGLYGLLDDTEISQEQIDEMTESNIVDNLVTELGDEFPGLKTTFLDKRDTHMAANIRKIEADKVVAVVGAAHVRGITKKLQTPDITTPETVPTRRISVFTMLKYGIPMLILSMFAYIFYTIGPAAARDAFLVWFGLNAVLAGTMAIVARAHPATISVAAVSAPFFSITPPMPTGLVAAYTENRFNPPTVGDLESIGTVKSYREFWSNTALRLILIFFLVNLGSSLGTYIGAGYLATIMAGA